VLNLVINARDAMTTGGRVIIRTGQTTQSGDRLTLRGVNEAAAPYVCVQVADNGPGMPAEVCQRAFEPFFTTKPKGTGTGLGLSMVHRFTQEASGRIELASEPGRGTVVSIYLPCHERRAVERTISA
jgi:signal transduction histidine kinase